MTPFALGVFVLCFTGDVIGLENGLGRTPPMGWMHWQRFRCVTDCELYPDECVSETLFHQMADIMATEGYLDAGYEYIIVDDCWMDRKRNENRQLVSDPVRFPSGMKALGDYIHNKGLKYGLYQDNGNFTCAGYPGSLYHFEEDANSFAEWGVDYVKLDGCYSDYRENMEKGYADFGKYLNATGRPMVYSCSWPAYQEPDGHQVSEILGHMGMDYPIIGVFPNCTTSKSNYEALQKLCNLWRNWDDIDDSWTSVTSIVNWFTKNQNRLAPYHGPGHWNDPDMLIIGNYGLTVEQSKAQMTIWCVMAAPLIMSNDLRKMHREFKSILLNRDAIAINQDPLGIQGKLIMITKSRVHVWTKQILPKVDDDYSFAVGLISNRTDGFAYKANVSLNAIGLNAPNGYTVQNIFEKDEPDYTVPPNGNLSVRVAPTGGVLLKLIPVEINKNSE